VRSYRDLVSDDPAWPHIASLAAQHTARINVLPRDQAAARACLEAIQVTTRSSLGALAHETGGILIDHGWLRMLGSGHPSLQRMLGGWNAVLRVPLTDFIIVADDVVGGVFAVNGGALGPARGNVYYFAPDTVAWQDLKLGHTAFVNWALTAELTRFYGNLRWPGWEAESERVGGDRAISLYPPPWSVEGQDVSKVHRGTVPAAELWHFQMKAAAGFAK
jgi:hypothetical protein